MKKNRAFWSHFLLLMLAVVISLISFSSCDKDDDDSDELNGTIWYSLFNDYEQSIQATPSKGYALYFSKHTVEWFSLDDHYRIQDKFDDAYYHLEGDMLYMGNATFHYSPNAIYYGGRLYVRQRPDAPIVPIEQDSQNTKALAH